MKSNRYYSILIFIMYLFTIGIVGYYFFNHSDYYLSHVSDKAHHPEYKILKPGGELGHALGIVGTLMMVLMLLYTVRKRTRLFGNFGMMSTWLNLHIFLGINGPLFIILHSTFKLNGLVAVSFWSMIIVALSGIFGRYLYLQIPRNIAGFELSREEVEKNYKEKSNRIKSESGFSDIQIQQWEAFLEKSQEGNASIIRFLSSLPIINLFHRRKLNKVLIQKFSLSGNHAKKVIRASHEMVQLNNKIQFWDGIHRLFHYWHVFHKPFAIIMYLIMIIHVGIAVWLGYTYF